ncbi:MAG: transposase [Chloroflexota bacterium]|nr:MAG: transposase [Chloroflexota bacterium]
MLSREIFYLLKEAQVFIERWQKHYNTVRPPGSLSYKPQLQRLLSVNLHKFRNSV